MYGLQLDGGKLFSVNLIPTRSLLATHRVMGARGCEWVTAGRALKIWNQGMAPHGEQDLAAILAGCRERRRTSQHDLYKLYYGYGMSVAIRYVNHESEAITIVNDAFLKVYNGIDSFKPEAPFKPWFRRIMVNTSITYLKKQQKYRVETDVDAAKDIADREEILSRISYKELVELVQSLSTAYRAVFNMYVIDGFRHEEIAAELGITVSTSKSNLMRARRKLRELLQAQLTTHNG